MNPVERYARESRELAALTRYWAMTALGISATGFLMVELAAFSRAGVVAHPATPGTETLF